MGWVFPRFGFTTQALLPLSAGAVTIKSNWIAGGVIWEWTQGGFQYVNDVDYGRSIQAAMWFDSNYHINPTEGGDSYAGGSQPLGPGWWHGAPLVTAYNDGATQVTSSVPLQWQPEVYGGSGEQPVAWLGYQLGKRITLNFNGMPRVAKYVTSVTAETAQNNTLIEAPALYGVAELNRYFAYDLFTDSVTEIFMTECVPGSGPGTWRFDFFHCGYQWPSPGERYPCWTTAGAAILASTDLTRAIGLYGRHPSAGGFVDFFGLVDGASQTNSNCGSGTGQYGFQFSLADAIRGYFTLPAGDSTYTTYIASGSLTQVKDDFKTLFQSGF